MYTRRCCCRGGMDRAVVKPSQQPTGRPTILQALGLDPNELEAVRKEQTHVLPFLFHGKVDNGVTRF